MIPNGSTQDTASGQQHGSARSTRRAAQLFLAVLALASLVPAQAADGAGPGGNNTIYLPLVNLPEPACSPAAVAQLRAVTAWAGQFSFAFKGGATAPMLNNSVGVASVDRSVSFTAPILLSKTHDLATFVQWRSGPSFTGQMIANDSFTQTEPDRTLIANAASFTEVAGSDVVSVILYPDQCKLRIFIWGFATGPITGALFPKVNVEFCATLDTKAPRAGAQSFSASVPISLNGASASSFSDVRIAGFSCHVGGSPSPDVGDDLFTSYLGLLQDGGTVRGAHAKGDAPLGNALVTYTFTPQ